MYSVYTVIMLTRQVCNNHPRYYENGECNSRFPVVHLLRGFKFLDKT